MSISSSCKSIKVVEYAEQHCDEMLVGRENVLYKPTSFLLTTYLMSHFLVEKLYYVTINRLSGKMTVFAHGYIYLLSKPKITKRADIHRGVSPNLFYLKSSYRTE